MDDLTVMFHGALARGLTACLMERKTPNGIFRLTLHAAGFFELTFAGDHGTETFKSRRLVFDGQISDVILFVVKGVDGLKLVLEQTHIPFVGEPLNARPFIVQMPDRIVSIPLEPVPEITPVVPTSARGAERLLVRKLGDIQQRAAAGDWYDLLQASGTLRQVLLDGQPLWNEAKRRLNIKPMFLTADFITGAAEIAATGPIIHWINLAPRQTSRSRLELNLDKFLGAPVLKTSTGVATVRSFISTAANVQGGIHRGNANLSDQQIVQAFERDHTLLESSPTLAALSAICEIALRALYPAVVAIQAM